MKVDLSVKQGETFSYVFRWETRPIVYKNISAITATAPVRLTVTGHGLVSGWRAAVVSVGGMTELNAQYSPPDDSDYHQVTVIDANTIEFNDVNALSYSAYTSGGAIQYNTPVSLAGFTARMTVRDRVGGDELLSLTTENDRIVISPSTNSISLRLTAVDSEELTFSRGVYDLELVSSTDEVTRLVNGVIRIVKEVTTS